MQMKSIIKKEPKNNIIISEESISKFIRPAKIAVPAPTFKKNSENGAYYLPRRIVQK